MNGGAINMKLEEIFNRKPKGFLSYSILQSMDFDILRDLLEMGSGGSVKKSSSEFSKGDLVEIKPFKSIVKNHAHGPLFIPQQFMSQVKNITGRDGIVSDLGLSVYNVPVVEIKIGNVNITIPESDVNYVTNELEA